MKLEPLDATVVIWIARVSEVKDSLPLLEPCLDVRDQERAARFRFPEDRARFVLGRGLLRKSLGHYLSRTPETIELTYTERGRPVLPQNEIEFNISHTNDLVAVALTTGTRIGIDLEFVQPNLDLIELAERILSEKDFSAFMALPTAEKMPTFYRVWTRKEAYLKACGEGISEGLPLISVSFGTDPISFLSEARDESAAQNWRMHTIPLPADYAGCLACDNAKKRVVIEKVRLEKGTVVEG